MAVFLPAPESAPQRLASVAGGAEPAVFRGLAAEWPAVLTWTPSFLAGLNPDLPVQLVEGNRERTPTRFRTSTLGSFLGGLDRVDDAPPLYLKEFDVLRQFPQLKADLRSDELFPPGSVTSRCVWIGPAGARTGLHYDLLDNFAVQIDGTKRFYVARPGVVEKAGGMSAKYDLWARLADVDVEALAKSSGEPDAFFVVDLEPGDVLYVPGGWWHEVVNVTPSILLSGFYGPRVPVVLTWLQVQARHLAHRAGLVGRAGCTCHAERGPGAGPA
jgi:lysine-specific demethylase 8